MNKKLSLLQRLLRPASIAVIGGNEATEVIRQCEGVGFEGDIWPVNPSRKEMCGRACFPNIDAFPTAPDAVFIAVPRQATIEIVQSLAQTNAGGAVCYASEFAEIGGEGIRAQQQLLDAAGELPIIGPNCYGYLNYLDGATLWPDQHGGSRCEHGVAIITQSGNMGISLTMQQRSVPLAYLISVGNMASLSLHDYIEVLLKDDRVKVIGLQFEGIKDIPAFSAAAIKASHQNIPIIALKSGRSELAKQAAATHTSSMTGADDLYNALFKRLGICRVDDLAQFLETLKFLSVIGPLVDNTIASISCSGGEAALTADLAQRHKLTFPPLSQKQKTELTQVLGHRVALANPLDYHTYIWGDENTQQRCFSAIVAGPQSVTLKILDFPRENLCELENWDKTIKAFANAIRETDSNGVVVATLPENLPEYVRRELIKLGIAPMQGLDECLLAISAASLIGQAQTTSPMQSVQTFTALNASTQILDEHQSKSVLAHYGIPIPHGMLCVAKDAKAAAENIGYPVVLKAVGSHLTHKTEAGGVKINLGDSEAVERAITAMDTLSEKFLVEKMASSAVAELLIGVTRDPQFGLAMLLSAGGVLTELLQDRQYLLFPVAESEVRNAVMNLRIYPQITGYRGQVAGDFESLVATILGIAKFAQDNANNLISLDINPLLVLPAGQGVLAVDALIVQSTRVS